MNEEQLEKLLNEKRSQTFLFDKSEEDFLADFIKKTEQSSPRKNYFRRYAAAFAVAAGLAVIAVISMQNNKGQIAGVINEHHASAKKMQDVSLDPMQESLRLFGDEVAVLFVGNDLVIGERMNTESPSNVLNVKLANNIELKIACADNDSISVNAPGVSGNVIVSRSDRQTLVLDVDLFIQGKRINTQIPVDNSKDIRMHS
ncbi:MAG: hypothetical protein J6T08_05725 [Lentisphaeria bacterium]|nr:hypothetical protein [Lentisphaeria bacterium]